MLKVRNYYKAINDFAPFNTAESWDNVGLIIGEMDQSVSKIMLALDATHKVVEEAIEEKADLIITHHPLLFSPIKKLDGKSVAYKLARNGIALISAHTNLDAADGGVNDVLAKSIGVKKISGIEEIASEKTCILTVYIPEKEAEKMYKALSDAGIGSLGKYSGAGFLSAGEGRFTPEKGVNPAIGEIGSLEKVSEVRLEFPAVAQGDIHRAVEVIKKNHPYEQPAFSFAENSFLEKKTYIGIIGKLENPILPKSFAERIKKGIGAAHVLYTDNGKKIETVGICSGSGNGVFKKAISMGVDAFVTGEVSHETVVEANNRGISVFQGGHFATENIVMPDLKEQIENRIKGCEIIISRKAVDEIKII